jgi:plastocyanin
MRGIAALTVVVFGAWAAPAMAANQDVTVGNNFFSPVEVSVNGGDTVTWHWAPTGTHSVTSRSGQAESFDSDPGDSNPVGVGRPASGTFAHSFSQTGCFRYYCKLHGSMQASVRVNGAECSATAPPGYGDPPPGSPGSPGTGTPGSGSDVTRPALSSISAGARTLCVKRSEDCRRTSTLVSFELSEAASVVASVVLLRSARTSARTVRRLRIVGRAGENRFRLRARRLKAGSYSLRFAAVDPAGNRARLKSLRFRVRR